MLRILNSCVKKEDVLKKRKVDCKRCDGRCSVDDCLKTSKITVSFKIHNQRATNETNRNERKKI